MTEARETADQGIVDRIWELDPDKMQAGEKMKQIYIFIGDIKALALATADQERTRSYLTPETVPMLWYFTRGTVAQQARTIIRELVPHAHLWLGHHDIHVLWMPGHNIPEHTDFHVDTVEVLDAAIKLKECGVFHNLDIKLGLVKTWLPLGDRYLSESIKLDKLNLAIEVLGYYYLQTRVVDLSRLTMRKSRESANRVSITGHDEYVYVLGEYRSKTNGGHLVNFHTSRHAREILKQVFIKFK